MTLASIRSFNQGHPFALQRPRMHFVQYRYRLEMNGKNMRDLTPLNK